MEYNSFYGGRQGASFVIQERYLTIAAMVEQFKKGNSYKTVNYDEFVIIDTENKNDPDNGKVYRRGYDYNNNMGGALYVGQIVGPAGLAPHAELKTIAEVRNIQETEGFEYRRGEGKYSISGNNIVPGKNPDGTFNDSIEWVYCSVRDENAHDTTVHIGFKFPYTVIEFTAKSASAYIASTAELASRIDDKAHPFYEKWQLQIPKGIKGDALKNLRETTDKDGKRILVYDSINYDNSASGTTVTNTIGFLNDIKNVSITSEGKITIEYSAAAIKNFSLKYPSTIALDSASQKLKVTYTDNTTALIGEPINYIQEMVISTVNYHLLVMYSDPAKRSSGANNISYNGKNGWIDLGAVRSDNGILIGGNIEDASLGSIQASVDYLNNTYPNGRDDGKIMTVGSSVNNKGFFAYNYGVNPGTWYYLGTIGSASVSAVAAPVNSDGSAPAIAQSLPTNGIWFITKTK